MLLGTNSYRATIVHAVNPICRELDRRVIEMDRPISVREWAQYAGADLSRSIVCVDGDFWLRDQWERVIPHGAVVAVAPLAHGGGGSNPLATILQIAVLVAGVYTGGLVTAAYGAAFGALTTAAISIGGSLLVNALVPPARVTSSVTGTTTSPTYGLQSTGNSARLLDSIPVVYGRMKVTPDLASQPYTEFNGNDQYLYELFCISQGQIDIESILIGDTPIGNFSEIDYEVVGPNQPVTLFPDNVVTRSDVTGIELQAPNDSGDWVGPFTANPAGSGANYIGIDLTLPSGLFYANDDGSLGTLALTFEVQAQAIDDEGNASGAWLELDNRELKMATAQPQQMSYRYAVPSGRYQVRARRTTDLNTDSRAQNRIDWAGMRAYLPSERYYGDCTLLALRARATNNLNSDSAHDVNVVCTRKIPVWNGQAWSDPQSSRSIAWAFADACRNTTYGAGLPDKRIDLDTLLQLDEVWASRGDQFNGVFDTSGTFWDALTTLAAAGRAIPMYFGGVVSIVRDDVRTVRTQLYTPDNIVAGSFSEQVSFYSADTPDYVDVQYLDEETWQWQDVECIPTGSSALIPSTIKMVGVTNRLQAWQLGIYRAYANRDQRRQVTITTELDGLIPRYGDLVGISHDLPQWGISGAVDGEDGNIVHVDQELEWTAGAQHYVYFIWPNGSPTAALRVKQPDDDADGLSMQLIDPLPVGFYFSDGYSSEPTRFSFGPGVDKLALDVRLVSATPDDNGQVELSFVNSADSPYLAESQQDPPAPVSPSSLPGIIHAPIITQVTVDWRIVPGSVVITAGGAQGAVTYEFDASANDGQSWQSLGTSRTNTLTTPIPVGDWIFRARAYGVSGLPGPYATWSGTVEEFVYLPVAPALSLREPFAGTDLSVQIQRLPNVDYFHVSVVAGGTTYYEADITDQSFTWTLGQAQLYGAVVPAFAVLVAGGNVTGLGPTTTLNVASTPPPAPTVQATPDDADATLTMSVPGYVGDVTYNVRMPDGTSVYSGPTATCTVAAGTYNVYALNSWGSQSPATVVVATTSPAAGT